MTRPQISRNNNGPDRSTEFMSRPKPEQLPKEFAALFVKADMWRERQSTATQTLNHITDPARDTEATKADDEAATAAVKTGKPAPARDHETQLAADRAQAARDAAAYPGIVRDAITEIEEARKAAAEARGFGTETAKLKDKLRADLDRAHATYLAFLESEARDAWIETATPMLPLRNLVTPADILNDLTRGVIPDQTAGTTVLANLYTALTQEN
ncbi:hypothetical protein [Arthrobacter sp. Y81]|uniref:hypothetical protein n=1 Tax=Arthrobacter sp. Y81 TaxID=2058897 RepID=UPI000CE34B6B|nr:hypothetical protein [Arthrobacter sp. Y81]